ncbi:MAG: hypothetical protein GY903_28950 [Fuerstiella sp.]|nr:hypothetical protein [Fuerstiella sp.]
MNLLRLSVPSSVMILWATIGICADLKDVVPGDSQSSAVTSPENPDRHHTEDHKLLVDAQQHCVFMTERQRPDDNAARITLKPNHRYQISVSGEAFLSSHTKSKADPFPGVTVFYCTNEQDGFATRTKVLKPGDQISFVSPKRQGKALFLSAFFLDYWAESPNRGRYELAIQAEPVKRPKQRHSKYADRLLNINFGREPRSSEYNGVIGANCDVWTLIDVGEQHKVGLPFADGTGPDVEVKFSRNDGEWGIADHFGVCHAYLYHNCRCVDLSVTLNYLPHGTYDVYVCAHGDAPDQNAAIEILSGDHLFAGKSTLNDGSWAFRSQELTEGNQYVKYTIDVEAGSPVVITSKRDGSNLSMFNAIQLKRLK